MSEDHGRGTILQQHPNPSGWIVGIERHVGSPGFEYRQGGDGQLRRPFQEKSDGNLAPDAERT
jgi:hypothetical protein